MPAHDESRAVFLTRRHRSASRLWPLDGAPIALFIFPLQAQAGPTGSFTLAQMDSKIRPSLGLVCLKKRRRVYCARVHRPCRTWDSQQDVVAHSGSARCTPA